MMTVPRRRVATTHAACMVAVVATACGGSSTTKKDVIARGNAICSSAVSSVRAVAPAKAASSGTALAGYFKQLEPIVANEVSQLRLLPRPDTDKAVLNRYIDAVTKAGEVYKQLVAAATRNDIPGVAKYLGALRASPAQSVAQQYGMSQCAAAAGTASP